MSKYAIEVRDIRKRFSLPRHRNDSVKSAITQVFKPKERGNETFCALNGVSFNVEKGDFFGILGRNGSGKSTLLKIISEIYQPTSGSVRHNGKLVSFIELGVGFKADLTGRENVFLNGALLGFSREEIADIYDDIVEFAELESFMDQKLKNYSSGMKVRLAFSVAIRAKADILILDEVLAVGDAAFQKKCTDYFETLKSDGKTVVLVTHSMSNVRRFCNRAVVIDGGGVVFNGEASKAADEYLALFSQGKPKHLDRVGSREVEVSDLQVDVSREEVTVKYELRSSRRLDSVRVSVDIHKKDKGMVTGVPGAYFQQRPITVDGVHRGRVVFENKFFDGDYYVYIRVSSLADSSVVYDDWKKACEFSISTLGVESKLKANLFIAEKSQL